MKLGIFATHPIQYHAPLFRELAGYDGVDLTVYFAHRPTAAEQGAGFGVAFDWDVDLLSGYNYHLLDNLARHPAQGFNGYDTPELAAIIAREKFDYFIVHGWSNRSCWQAFRACWQTGTPLAVRSDSQLEQGRMSLAQLVKQAVKRLAYPYFIRRFDLCLPYGQRSAEYFRYYGARRIAIAPHFIDNDYFARQASRNAQHRNELRRQWGIPEEAFCFLFCGKFIVKKRPRDVLCALEMLLSTSNRLQSAEKPTRLDDCTSRGVHLLMVGDGVLREECEQFASSRQLPVSFTGFLNQGEIAAAYVAADCLVLPSDSGETWGLVVNEAMACGLPAIVSEACGCVPDLIEDGVTGYGFPCGDIVALTGVMAKVVHSRGVPAALSVGVDQRISSFTQVVAATALLTATTGETNN